MSFVGNAKPFGPIDMKAKKTKEGYATAKAAFNTFATLQGVKRLEEITIEDFATESGCQHVKDLFSAFADFLLKHTNAPKGSLVEKHFRPDVQTGYLGNIKNYIKKKFPNVAMMKEKDDEEFEWYKDIIVSSRFSVATSPNVSEPQY
jgi:hypothetical protein